MRRLGTKNITSSRTKLAIISANVYEQYCMRLCENTANLFPLKIQRCFSDSPLSRTCVTRKREMSSKQPSTSKMHMTTVIIGFCHSKIVFRSSIDVVRMDNTDKEPRNHCNSSPAKMNAVPFERTTSTSNPSDHCC